MLHTADISHPAKAWDLHHRWTMSLLEEFFRQVPCVLLVLDTLSIKYFGTSLARTIEDIVIPLGAGGGAFSQLFYFCICNV